MNPKTVKNIFAFTLAFAIIAFAYAFATPAKAKVVTVPDVLSVVETLKLNCYENGVCTDVLAKVYDSNNQAVCYFVHYNANNLNSEDDKVAISCIK